MPSYLGRAQRVRRGADERQRCAALDLPQECFDDSRVALIVVVSIVAAIVDRRAGGVSVARRPRPFG